MPCQSDYLEPDGFEKESQEVAQHLVYISSILKKPIPSWVHDCANNIYGAIMDGNGGDDRLVPMLCTMLSKLSKQEIERVVYNAKDKRSRKLADWWEKHQDSDKQRLKAAEEEKEIERIRERALAKLNAREIEALGLSFLTIRKTPTKRRRKK